jgi:hypothetical protein
MDARGRPSSSLILSTGNAVAVGGNNPINTAFAANTPVDLIFTDIQEIVLAPGDAIDFITSTVNVSLVLSLLWRERFLEDPERQ